MGTVSASAWCTVSHAALGIVSASAWCTDCQSLAIATCHACPLIATLAMLVHALATSCWYKNVCALSCLLGHSLLAHTLLAAHSLLAHSLLLEPVLSGHASHHGVLSAHAFLAFFLLSFPCCCLARSADSISGEFSAMPLSLFSWMSFKVAVLHSEYLVKLPEITSSRAPSGSLAFLLFRGPRTTGLH